MGCIPSSCQGQGQIWVMLANERWTGDFPLSLTESYVVVGHSEKL